MGDRLTIRRGLTGLCLLLLAACAARPTAERAPPDPSAEIEPIYVVTERALNKTGANFGLVRNEGLNHFRASVSVPATHQPGRIEWPEGPPDAATDFVVTDTKIYDDEAAFVRDVHAETSTRETLMFVHGYNNTLSESLYRLTQIQADFDTNMPAVLYSWQSAGDARGYVYDRDSVLFARDDMERTLRALTGANGEKVFIVAHSLGSHLTMEVLRQIALRGDRQLLSRISGVVLMSPDIDPEIFRRQADAIGPLPQPFLIFISRQDKALTLAGLLTGLKPRLGVIDSVDQVAELGVTVVDFTELSDGEGFNHFVPVTSPAAMLVLRGMIAQAEVPGNTGFSNSLVLKNRNPKINLRRRSSKIVLKALP